MRKYKPEDKVSTLVKIIHHLITVGQWFKCDFDSITKDEYLRVLKALDEGKIYQKKDISK